MTDTPDTDQAPGGANPGSGAPSDDATAQVPALIEASAGRLLVDGARLLEFDAWQAVGRGCCLTGDFSPLLRWLLHEGELEGSLTIAGQPPHEALRSGGLGLGLASSPWDPGWTVGAALEASASLVGASKTQVDHALGKTRLARHRSVRVAQLNRPLRQLLALAAAVVTEPAVILLDRPFAGLDDEAAQFVETVIWDVSEGRRWIALVDVAAPWERRLCERADAGVFVARAGRIVGPFDSSEWLAGPQVFWVQVRGDGAAEALGAEASQLDPGPTPDTFVVQGLSGRRIAQLAASAGATLRELVPLSHAASCY